MPTVC